MVLARSGGKVVDQIGGQFFGDGGASGLAGAGGEQSGERADGGLFGGYFWGWGGTWIVAHGFRGFHDFDPYGQGHAAAVGLTGNAFWLIQSDPDAAGQAAGEADEPSIFEVVSGAGFSGGGGGIPEGAGAGGGASGSKDFFEHFGDAPSGPWSHGWIAHRFIAKDGVAFAILDVIEKVRAQFFPAIGECGIGAGEGVEGGVVVSQTELWGRVGYGSEAQSAGQFDDMFQAGALGDAHGHGISRPGEPGGGGQQAAKDAVGISWRPAADFHRAVVYERAGKKPGLRSGGVDEWFEGAADRAFGHQRAIKWTFLKVPATDDGNGGAGCIVDDDDRPLHILGSGGGGPGFFPRQPLGASGVRVTARLFYGGQLLFEGRFRGHLQRQINRGVNPQTAVLFIFSIKHGVERAAHGIERIRFLTDSRGFSLNDRSRRHGRRRLVRPQALLLHHSPQYHIAPRTSHFR